ncbi:MULTISPECIES: class I SAM-dependent methyltransferase [unclassified Okeania]|uniref:class I SAM-dependent methyltransferase n=1 Tax=unclassified Okeania TaxID=2634635 RepID=UPI0013B9C1E7|nr:MULTISPECIES: class I SAM-dependent methyltransferase [unclassified Okeania]NES76927.1 DUF563 domain-containing protein [Okeania sp. SIO1H4]NET20556.1 DUF563 domain-containing protein [Okeania sp. SIO1H5]NET93723.1 DUF563 domain-containing protein [Okeania sp. SIO1H2]
MNGNKEQKQHISLSQVKEKLHNYQSELEQIKSKLDSKSISKSRQTFQEVEENVINSFVQSSTIVVENYDADSHPIYDELFWGYKIEDIQENTNDKNTINISGWVLGKKSPVVAIEIVELSSILKKISVNQLRPDIAKRYPEAPQVKEIGFSIDFPVKKLRPKFNWLIQAVFTDETRMPIGCMRTNNTKSLNIKATPLLTKEAIKFLENFLKQKPDAKVLEFGSGGSTIWLSKLTKNLTSIEHDGMWFNQVKDRIQKQKNCHPVEMKLLARPYHTICEKFPAESLDLIIVDGRDRVKCFEASIKLLKPGGILMLDDAQRERYQQAQDLLKDWQFTKTVSNTRHTYWWEKPLQEAIYLGKNQSTFEENVVIADVSIAKEENRLFQIQNAIVKPILRLEPRNWVGGVVFPKDMPGIFRHRRPKIQKDMKYQDVFIQVDDYINNFNNCKFYPGTYIYGGSISPHFGHALTEGIHRLWAFNTNIHDGIVFAVLPRRNTNDTNYTPPQWFVQALEILEIPLTKCIWVTNDCAFENLIVPEPGSEFTLGPKNWYRSYLEKLQQKIFDATHHLRKEKGEIKLFLGRNHIPLSEHIGGEKYWESLLVDEGYISLKPENYSMLEQVAYLMSAKKIIFSEGSAIYSLEFLNYLDADIACIARRPNNQFYYPHIYSKCRNYIVAGNAENILRLGSGIKKIIIKKPINKNPYEVVESLRNHNFALVKDWDEEKFLAQEKSDVLTYIENVKTQFKNLKSARYLEILEEYLEVRKNQKKESSNLKNYNQNMVLKRRSDRLNKLATINQSSNYLEIGVAKGVTFNAINIKNKVAVDPKFQFKTKEYATENIVFLEVTSDEFFKNHAKGFESFDLIYIDGLHTFEQTFRDFCASVSLAHAKTIWLIDDTCPGSYAQAQPSLQNCVKLKRISQEKPGAWMGDVFKVVAAIHDFFPQFSFATFPDHGQTVVWNQWRKDFQPKWNSLETISRLEYLDFVELQGTLFKREPYEQIFESIKSAYQSKLSQVKTSLEKYQSLQQETTSENIKSTPNKPISIKSPDSSSTNTLPDRSENMLVKISSLKILKPDTNLLHGYYLDRPKQGEIFNQNTIKLAGWVVGKNSPAVAIEIISNGQVIKTVPINQQRSGVAKVYPQIPQAKTSGFATEIELMGLPKESELTLQVILKDKSLVPLGSIKGLRVITHSKE